MASEGYSIILCNEYGAKYSLKGKSRLHFVTFPLFGRELVFYGKDSSQSLHIYVLFEMYHTS